MRVSYDEGDTLASAMHRNGILEISRSMKYHRPRGIYCAAGSCASCFVSVDGIPNVPACMSPAQDGQQVESQNRLGSAKRDLLGITDKVYRRGFDPHGAFTKPRLLNRAFLMAVRFMSGVGKVPAPDVPAAPRTLHRIDVDELIIGAGHAGLRCALAAVAPGKRVLLVDELGHLGGTLAWDPSEFETADLVAQVAAASVETWTGALAFGIYDDVVAVACGGDLYEVRADRITIAPGSHDAWPLFENNDMPGVMSARAARRLLHGHGVLPGRRVVVHGKAPDAAFVQAIEGAGGKVIAHGQVDAARGGTRVAAAKVGGVWHDCDAIVCDLPGTPRVELFQQAGCRLGFRDGVLKPITKAGGATTRPDVWWGGA